MRLLLRILGWLLTLIALVIAGRDIAGLFQTGSLDFIAAGALWYQLDVGSLNLVQAVIERYVWEPLWDPVIVTILQWPATLVIGVPGVILILTGSHRRRSKRHFGH